MKVPEKDNAYPSKVCEPEVLISPGRRPDLPSPFWDLSILRLITLTLGKTPPPLQNATGRLEDISRSNHHFLHLEDFDQPWQCLNNLDTILNFRFSLQPPTG
ncbi:hypothetical protein J3R74_003792 [Puniceicoccus vermicola]